jgi:hypothetical protein
MGILPARRMAFCVYAVDIATLLAIQRAPVPSFRYQANRGGIGVPPRGTAFYYAAR